MTIGDNISVPEDLTGTVGYMVRLVQIAAYKNFEATTKKFGLLPRYYGMLRIIEDNPGIRQSRLAEAIYLDRSSLVPILDALGRQRIVERHPSPTDKRLRCVHMTEKGLARLNELKPLVEAHEATLVAGLTETERVALVGLLQRVDANLRTSEKEGSP